MASNKYRSTNLDKVPPEVWEQIFLHAVLPPTATMPFPTDAPKIDTRASISHTCSLWRDIAVSRPLMWTELVVHFRGEQQTPNFHLVERVIGRSAGSLLSINLCMIDEDESLFQDITSAACRTVEFLCESITQWRELRLYLRGCGIPIPLCHRLHATGFPWLDRLEIDARLQCTESDSLFKFLWFRSPRLRKLLYITSNDTDTFFLSRVPRTIPFGQLTSFHLHISSPSMSEISISLAVYVLQSAYNLVSCVFTSISVYPGSSVASFPQAVRLPRLEYLHLAMHPPSTHRLPHELPLTLVLDYITAPSLRTIAFTNMDMWGQPEFERFISRSGCSLEEIHFLNPWNFGASSLIPILRGLPSIKGLHLGRMQNLLDDPTYVIDMIAWNDRRREFELCPNLSWLSFRDPTSFDIIPDCDINTLGMYSLTKILKTRLGPPSNGERKFERVYIPADQTDSYDSIRALCADPYALDIQHDDGEMYDIYSLWLRYGDR